MAKKLDLSQSSISRIWRAFGLKPQRRETFVLWKGLAIGGQDPALSEAEWVRDRVGLYLSPPANALVLCVDEPSGAR